VVSLANVGNMEKRWLSRNDQSLVLLFKHIHFCMCMLDISKWNVNLRVEIKCFLYILQFTIDIYYYFYCHFDSIFMLTLIERKNYGWR
jgi:hypothetical protein